MATSQHYSSPDSCFAVSPVNGEENHVQFSEDEEALIIRMHNLVGDRWALIAGRIPGRNAEEIKKYWISRYSNTCLGK